MNRSIRPSGFLLILLIAGFCQLVCLNGACAKKNTQNTPYQEYLYQQKVLRKIEKSNYKESLLPFSGFMSSEDYEKKSKDVPTSSISIPDPKLPNDINMKYIPQPTYKLTRYNSPPGTPEIRIDRSLRFDRQVNGQGVTSPDKSMMVYPAIYYYVSSKTTACDLFVIPLDMSLPDVDRVLRANVARRNPDPILSTDKSIDVDYAFKTMTPIDFSADGLRLLAKEKIGYEFDGIWKTNLWSYDFETKTAKNLVEVRDAIKLYWLETKGIRLDEKRWDIFPLGFDVSDPTRIIVTAYAYTGDVPKFLGTWSVDYKGERTLLVSLFDANAGVSTNGYKLVQSGVVNIEKVFAAEKTQNKTIKANRKKEKKVQKTNAKAGQEVLNKKIKEMKAQEAARKKIYQPKNTFSAPTGMN